MIKRLFALGLLLAGCTQDITISDLAETHVVVDQFQQVGEVGELDVLVVLDTSCSMRDDFVKVTDGIINLRADIETISSDYEIMFITNDERNPDFIGPFDSGSTDLDLFMAPSALVGSGNEAGFAAHYQFHINTSNKYPDFMRDTADLLVFQISDEPEQSNISASVYAQWLRSLKTEAAVDVVSIVSTSWECGGFVGSKYIELVEDHFNKGALDLCFDDWSPWLSQSSFLTSKIDRYTLSQKPIIKSIVVYVDFHPINHGSDWIYDASTNTVHFLTVPEHGQIVAIGYDVEA